MYTIYSKGADLEKNFQRGSKFYNDFFVVVFLVDKGIEDPNTAINGPSSARQRNTTEIAFGCRAYVGPN